MGRPLNKRFFGPLNGEGLASSDTGDQVGNTLTDGSKYNLKGRGYNIPVEQACIIGGTLDIGGDGAPTPYIIAQKGTRKYRVMTSSGQGNCYLVNDDGSSQVTAGEMVIKGYLNGDSGNTGIAIKKLTKFYATDFNGNRYKWYVAQGVGTDSSFANLLALVPATTTTVGSDKI